MNCNVTLHCVLDTDTRQIVKAFMEEVEVDSWIIDEGSPSNYTKIAWSVLAEDKVQELLSL